MIIDTQKTIEFLEELSPWSTYYPIDMIKDLRKLGFSAEVMIKENGIVVEGMRIESVMPEMGEPGIYSLHLLSSIYQLLTNGPAISNRQGRGFWYRDILQQLKENVDVNISEGSQ